MKSPIPTVLIIDDKLTENDKQHYLQLCKERLDKGWYKLEFAASGTEGLELIKADSQQRIALIILDLLMDKSELDGVTLANLLAKSHVNIKIILYTAYPQWEDKLNQEARKNIVSLIEKGAKAPRVLRDFIDMLITGEGVAAEFVVDQYTRRAGLPTLRKLAKGLSSELRLRLIYELLPTFSLKTLEQIKREIPAQVDEIIEQAAGEDELKQWVFEQQKANLLPVEIPTKYVNKFWLEIREKEKKDEFI